MSVTVLSSVKVCVNPFGNSAHLTAKRELYKGE